MKKIFKLSIISLLLIFITLPKIVLAAEVYDTNKGGSGTNTGTNKEGSDTHTRSTINLGNNKKLVVYYPKSKVYKHILVHFHGYDEDTINSHGMAALETAMQETDYSNIVVFFPIDGISSKAENTATISETINLIYKEYQNFLTSNHIGTHTLSVSQFSGTRDAANMFINLLNENINLFLFDSYEPNDAYNETSLKKINNLIMLSETQGIAYLDSAKLLGENFRKINKTGLLKHFIDNRHEHGLADDIGFQMYSEFIKTGDIDDDFLTKHNIQASYGTNTNPGTSTTPGTSTPTTPSEEEDTPIYGGGKDTGTTTVEDSEPRLKYDNMCASEGFRTASKIAGVVILIAKWLGPLILMIMGMIDFGKAIISSSDKALSDATGTFIKRMIIAIVTPIIPGLLYYLVDFLIGEEIADTKIDFGECTECLKKPLECKVDLYDYDNQRGESKGE